MNILITGGSGLLGSEINLSNGLKPSSKELNLLDYCALKRYIQLHNVNKIIHCAAMVGGVNANYTKMFDFFDLNLQINTNILRACKEFNLNNSIFILSTCAMPWECKLPYTEESLHVGEPHFTNYGYAYTKRMLEVGSRSLKQQYGINTICLIPSNLYGPNDNYNLESGHVIPSLIHKCFIAKKNNEDFVVWGTGMPMREFVYAKDFARIIETIVNKDHEYSPMIISSEEEYSIRDLVSSISKSLDFGGRILYDISKPDGIYKKTTSKKTFKKYFPDFKMTNIEDGLVETIQHFVSNYPNIRL
jgi:GDP-L-fucose synthase